MMGNKRRTGIEAVGEVSWGSHGCHFYRTREDLVDILVPYFQAGLEDNEFCLWLTSEPLGVEEARASLRKVVRNLDDYIEKGQIEILDANQWYTRSGKFEAAEVLQSWVEKERLAREQGFDGLRASGNMFWLESKDWKDFAAYEAAIDSTIGKYQMIAICSYSLERCGALEIIEVLKNHEWTLARTDGEWELFESARRRQMKETLWQSEQNFRNSLDNSPLGVRIVTAEGRLLYANKAILDICDYNSLEELARTPTKQRYTPESYAEHQVRKEKRQHGEYVSPNYEISIVGKDGQVRHLAVRRREVIWNGESHFQVLYENITERKQAEEKLRESEERYRLLVENQQDLVVKTDIEGRLLYVNPSYCELFDKTEEELLGTSYAPLVHPDDLPVAEEAVASLFKPPFKCSYEERASTRHGWRWISWTASAVRDEHGAMSALVGSGRDITERKEIEAELRVKNNAISSSINAIAMADFQGNLTYVNLSFLQMWGYDDEKEVLGKSVLEFWETGENAAEVVKTLQKGEGWQGELVARKKDGFAFHVQLAASLVTDDTGKPVCLMASFIDITERKRAEEASRESQERYKELADLLPQIVFELDETGSFIFANRYGLENSGYTQQDIEKGLNALQLFIPEDRNRIREDIQRILAGERSSSTEYTAMRKDGSTFAVLVYSAPITRGGKTAGLRGLAIDITERKRAEEALQKSMVKYRELAESIGDVLFSFDRHLRYTYWNKASEKLMGISAQDALGKHLYDIFPRDEQTKKAEEAYLKALKENQPQYLVNEYQLGAKHFFFEIGAYPVEDGLTVLVRDITERRQLEKELQRVERLESIGTLAGGIAHDFNNILTVILGNITLAETYIEPEGKAAKTLLEAKKASFRARDLTQQLLTFSRGGAPVKEVASLAELLEESALFVLRGSNVKCEFYLSDNLWSAEIDRGQISQVITNLVINADEAMPEGGLLTIGAKNTVIKRKGALPLPEGDYVEITVEDHGVGIPKKHLGTIFDPYFTTKKKGSGLGLATTYSIIRNHNGHIEVESEPGTGTTFRIYLPASKKPVTKKEEVEKEVWAASPGRKRILVMDDEEPIRDMLSSALSMAGFEVELASDGKEAIERYEKAMESGQPFDVVIMDLTIPGGMGGKEAIKELIKIDPDIKAIVSSGYFTDPIMADFMKYGFVAVMPKPYSISEMKRTLQRIFVRA